MITKCMSRQLVSLLAGAMLLGTALMPPVTVRAQELPPKAGPARTVKMFDLFCFSHLPDIASIANVAKAGEFAEITGAELQKYQPQVPAEEIRAWRFDDHGGQFTLVATRSKPDAQFKQNFPDFANADSYACSLITPGNDASAGVTKEMTGLMERPPDEQTAQGRVEFSFWGSQTDEFVVFVHQYSSAQTKTSNLLSASAFVKK